jgi:hypothetical protein
MHTVICRIVCARKLWCASHLLICDGDLQGALILKHTLQRQAAAEAAAVNHVTRDSQRSGRSMPCMSCTKAAAAPHIL